MKRSKRKALIITTIVMMLMSLFSVATFAAETGGDRVAIGSFNSGTITINSQNDDDSFALYKVVNVSYNEASNTVDYAFTTAAGVYAAAKGVDIDAYKSFTEDQLKDFIGGYAAYVKDSANSVTADLTGTASAKVATITGATMGQYLVLGTGTATGPVVYQPMTATFVPDENLQVNTTAVLSSKATVPGITKQVVKDTAATNDSDVVIGEEILFEIKMDVPTYPAGATNKTFKVVDTLSTGLAYKQGSASLAPTSVNGQVLTWEYDYEQIKNQQQVTITYSATVTDEIIANGYTATNEAVLTYGNDPYGQSSSTPAVSKVYTYGIEITKVDANDNNIKLEGVTFDVYKDSKDGVKVATITTDRNGIATYDGLALGKYVLVETKAANGYNLPPALVNGIEIELTDSNLDGVLDNDNDAVKSQQITNSKGAFNLPTTGGIGTWIFTLAGIALLAMAVAFMLIMRRRQQAKA